MSMSVSSTSLSRRIAHALRHEPWTYGVELDAEGWVPVDNLLAGLRTTSPAWANVSRADLERMLASSSARRYELSGDRIRARYGHSIRGLGSRTPAPAPSVLFHGTAPSAWQKIRGTGLQPMGRQYVHLSVDTAQAFAVGRRKHPEPVVLQIDAASAQEAGISFYPGNELVWLAERVPPEFVTYRES